MPAKFTDQSDCAQHFLGTLLGAEELLRPLSLKFSWRFKSTASSVKAFLNANTHSKGPALCKRENQNSQPYLASDVTKSILSLQQ